MKAMWRYRYRC